jgi:transcriptional regulator with XRE-family HTH domain
LHVTDDRLQRNPLGPAGRRVRDHVKTLRVRRGMTHQQLSDLVKEYGRVIPVLGISRIENGARRVDVDDLEALAGALYTHPMSLMGEDDPDTRLSAEDYDRHREAIDQAVELVLQVSLAGVGWRHVTDYIANQVYIKRIHRGER